MAFGYRTNAGCNLREVETAELDKVQQRRALAS
jgi:hypothetical protein